MTSDAHHHTHHHADSLAELLDLDAQVLHGYWSDAMTWVRARTAGRPPRRILDVGAGTGSGTMALAEQFTDAEIVAADVSTAMLRRIRDRAAAESLAARVSTVEMDLGAPWPELGTFDVVWASAVLHELADADVALHNMFNVLSPGGLLAVVELDGPPRFLDDRVGDGLEERIHEVLGTERAGDNDHPDWSSSIERAGFAAVEKTSFSIDMTLDAGGLGGRYAQMYLRRIQPVVAGGLSESDRRMLDALVSDTGEMSVRNRDDLHLRAGRTAWAAHRP